MHYAVVTYLLATCNIEILAIPFWSETQSLQDINEYPET